MRAHDPEKELCAGIIEKPTLRVMRISLNTFALLPLSNKPCTNEFIFLVSISVASQ